MSGMFSPHTDLFNNKNKKKSLILGGRIPQNGAQEVLSTLKCVVLICFLKPLIITTVYDADIIK